MRNNNMELIDSLDKLQRFDHDTLTRLSTNFDSFLNRYADDMKELKEGTTSRINDLDSRVRIIETVHEKVQPEDAIMRLSILQQDYHDFKRSWKIAQTIVIFLAAAIGFVLSGLSNLLSIAKH